MSATPRFPPPLMALCGLAVLVGAWVLAASLLYPTERYDGWDTIWNARALATGGAYVDTRPPLLAWLLMPADAWMRARGAAVDTLWPYRLTSALLHVVFLAVTAAWLWRGSRRGWAPLIAFAAAVPTFLFFTQAHQLSADIFPGVMLVGMLVLWDPQARDTRVSLWIALVVLGALAALTKESFGVFWAALLVGYALCGVATRPRLVALAGAAAVSALLYWVVFSSVLGSWRPQVPFSMRVGDHLVSRLAQYGDAALFPWWVYARNVGAWGAAWLLAIPGGLLAWRRSPQDRIVVVTVATCVVVFHLVSQREVRYLLFLAPLLGRLAVILIEETWERPAVRWVLLACVVLGSVRGVTEATAVLQAAGKDGPQQCFMKSIGDDVTRAPGIAQWHALSFRQRPLNDLPGDRYFGLAHLSPRHTSLMLGRPVTDLQGDQPENFHRRGMNRAGWLLLLANHQLVNDSTAWDARPPLDMETFQQHAAVATVNSLQDGAFSDENGAVRLATRDGSPMPVWLFPAVQVDKDVRAAALQPDGTWRVVNGAVPAQGASVRISGFRVVAHDDATRCLNGSAR